MFSNGKQTTNYYLGRVFQEPENNPMVMNVDTDVAIVGAGPAGLSAAKTLENQGVQYSLYAKEESPCKDKPCGGFIPKRTLMMFDLEGLPNAYPISSIVMRFPGVGKKQVDFDEPVGVNVSRAELGLEMLSALQNRRPNIHLKHEILSVNLRDGACILRVRSNGSEYEVTSNMIIDASGAYPVSVKSGLVRPKLNPQQMGYGHQYHFRKEEGAPDFKPVNRFFYGHEFSPGGYAWIFPRRREIVVGSGGLVSRVKESNMRVSDYIERVIREPSIKSLLSDSALYKKDAAPVPLGGRITPSVDDNIILAGDAAAHCSPISGEGIHYSLLAGRIAGNVSSKAVSDHDYSAENLNDYEDLWKNAFGSDLKWGLWLQNRFTGSKDGGNQASFLNSEKSSQIVAEMLVGQREVFNAMLAIAPQYIWSKISGFFR